jgi:hypothetical protein
MSLRTWVNVVLGKMTQIDRRHKRIFINNETELHYDHLVLCTGEQYYHVAPIKQRVFNLYTKQQVKPTASRPLFTSPPSNMFVINHEHDAEQLLVYIEENKLTVSNGKKHTILIFART